MNPKTVAFFQKDVPEFRELVAFIAKQLQSLNSLEGMEKMDSAERAVEVTARLRARETLLAILSPLVQEQNLSTPQGLHDDYAVNVD